MELTIYNVIKGPKVTEKAYSLNQKLKQLVLEVHVDANKIMIAQALKKLFDVDVKKINTDVRKGKKRRMGKHYFVGKLTKKVFVFLKEGQSIDLTELSRVSEVSEPTSNEK